MAFPSGFVIRADGSLVPSRSFLTSWLRLGILRFLTLALRSSRCYRWMTSSEMTEMSCCCVPSMPSGSICPGRSSIVQGLRVVCLNRTEEEEGVPYHDCLLVTLCDLHGPCFCFRGRLSLFEGQSS